MDADACIHHWLLPIAGTTGTCKLCGAVRHFGEPRWKAPPRKKHAYEPPVEIPRQGHADEPPPSLLPPKPRYKPGGWSLDGDRTVGRKAKQSMRRLRLAWAHCSDQYIMGRPITVREVATAIGSGSTGVAYYYLSYLCQMGYLEHDELPPQYPGGLPHFKFKVRIPLLPSSDERPVKAMTS